ncbi:MAG: GTPase ObgE [Blastocatellia bacterium]|nr:GTPase ObgE [Chloracidobacterium sp.]MBL8184920.1 GTPase ObgE [Blastocatellia bacterium]HBE81187.1 GTPase ObgE [Blastocatellia bacterium]HRJ88868.1 GTPase ObgE [Pyrinomonadaceae bacterium]HRK50358.1 GTPase ObgE [Pyrinomonadaceae bacterium]
MFLDRVKIKVMAGDGGNGVTAFRREKFVPRGGPSGGDGGVGGSVWVESTEGLNTLLHLRYNPEHKAERGRHGEGSNRSGKDGSDAIVKVPVGTQVFDVETSELLFDFTEPGQRFLAAKGGKGGWGNAHFATPTRRAPKFHYTGRPGEEKELQLELKLIADVGLVGFPNAGKSTLISVISAAKPKIADYPFTTLEPNLGVVDVGDYKTFVVADIPGLIEGASTGAGLGDRFLRHVERTKLILHLVDVSSLSGRDPVKDYQTINTELAAYDPELAARPQIVVATKIDALDEPERLESLKIRAEQDGKQFLAISSVANTGIKELVFEVVKALDVIGNTTGADLVDE